MANNRNQEREQNKSLDQQCSNDSRPRDTAVALALAIE